LPPAIVLALALLGSLAVHLPIYAGLGALSHWLDQQGPTSSAPIEFTLLDPTSPSAIPTPSPVPEEPSSEPPEPLEQTPPDEPEPPTPRRETRRPEERPRVEVPVRQAAPPPPEAAPAPPTPPPPPPPPIDERRAIVQRSDEPPEEAPPDAQFIAEQARDVEEQTVARFTNSLRDDPEPTPGEQHEAATEEPGDSDEHVAADMRDVEGDDRRRVVREEAERPVAPEAQASVSRQPRAASAESLDPGTDENAREGRRVRSAEGGARAMGGGEEQIEEVVVSDGFGTFVVRRPRRTLEGNDEGEAGGPRRDGRGMGSSGEGLAAGASGRRHGGARHGSVGRQGGPQLGVSWSQFESIYGEEDLRQARQARLEERRSRSRGASRQAQWEAFRSAIENYIAEVRPGNQTALDAAASPFATFLSDMHRRIHREFSDRYLASLALDASGGVNDPTLRTTLEISINEDGSIHSVGVIATSGNILHDFAAYRSVMQAQPYPSPPDAILSGDGRAWLHWSFDRGPRQCFTGNARPFMLANTREIDRGEPDVPEE
jgi:hypothetical protein